MARGWCMRMNTTYKAILASLDGAPCQNSEFIELNKYAMCGIYGRSWNPYSLSPDDYKIFWGCMKIYNSLGINYFANYLKIISLYYGDFSHGLKGWLLAQGGSIAAMNIYSEHDEHLTSFCQEIQEICETLRFFELDNYGGLSLSELETMLETAPNLWRSMCREEFQRREEKSELTKQNKVNSFYNFEVFSEKRFSDYVEACTIKRKKGGDMSIDDALKLAQNAPQHTYIVTLSRAGSVIFVGKTAKLLEYLGARARKYEADSASFEKVDIEYADDVLLAVTFFYELPLDNVRISKTNRKYTTLKNACFVYKRVEGWPRKKILSAVRDYKLRQFETPSGDIILDKIALEKALR